MTCDGYEENSTQAFSHWTSHSSGGKCSFCDCQGICDKKKGIFILTDPVIVSKTEFGPHRKDHVMMEKI